MSTPALKVDASAIASNNIATHRDVIMDGLKKGHFNFPINEECTSLCITPSGHFVVAGFSDGTIRIFDLTGTFHASRSVDGDGVSDGNGLDSNETELDDDHDASGFVGDMDSDSDDDGNSSNHGDPHSSNSRGTNSSKTEGWGDLPSGRTKTSQYVLSKAFAKYGAVASQIHARGVHTDLLLHIEVSPDGMYCFAGVQRGSMELHAIHLGALEDAVQKAARYGKEALANKHLLDYITVEKHADGKLKGFGACTCIELPQSFTSSSSQANTTTTTTTAATRSRRKYFLLTGKAIKNIHIWSFMPSTKHPVTGAVEVEAQWERLYDTQTNGNTIRLLGFSHDFLGNDRIVNKRGRQSKRTSDSSSPSAKQQNSGDNSNGNKRANKTQFWAISQSDTQKLRLWDLSNELKIARNNRNDSEPTARPKRPPYVDVVNTESALGLTGPFCVCGGAGMFNQMSIVRLDQPKAQYNRTELALPDSGTSSRSRRRAQRGDLKLVKSVATLTNDPSRVLLELDNGSMVQYTSKPSDGNSGLPKLETLTSDRIPTPPSDGYHRKVCMSNMMGHVVAAAVSLYDPITGQGHIAVRPLDWNANPLKPIQLPMAVLSSGTPSQLKKPAARDAPTPPGTETSTVDLKVRKQSKTLKSTQAASSKSAIKEKGINKTSSKSKALKIPHSPNDTKQNKRKTQPRDSPIPSTPSKSTNSSKISPINTNVSNANVVESTPTARNHTPHDDSAHPDVLFAESPSPVKRSIVHTIERNGSNPSRISTIGMPSKKRMKRETKSVAVKLNFDDDNSGNGANVAMKKAMLSKKKMKKKSNQVLAVASLLPSPSSASPPPTDGKETKKIAQKEKRAMTQTQTQRQRQTKTRTEARATPSPSPTKPSKIKPQLVARSPVPSANNQQDQQTDSPVQTKPRVINAASVQVSPDHGKNIGEPPSSKEATSPYMPHDPNDGNIVKYLQKRSAGDNVAAKAPAAKKLDMSCATVKCTEKMIARKAMKLALKQQKNNKISQTPWKKSNPVISEATNTQQRQKVQTKQQSVNERASPAVATVATAPPSAIQRKPVPSIPAPVVANAAVAGATIAMPMIKSLISTVPAQRPSVPKPHHGVSVPIPSLTTPKPALPRTQSLMLPSASLSKLNVNLKLTRPSLPPPTQTTQAITDLVSCPVPKKKKKRIVKNGTSTPATSVSTSKLIVPAAATTPVIAVVASKKPSDATKVKPRPAQAKKEMQPTEKTVVKTSGKVIGKAKDTSKIINKTKNKVGVEGSVKNLSAQVKPSKPPPPPPKPTVKKQKQIQIAASTVPKKVQPEPKTQKVTLTSSSTSSSPQPKLQCKVHNRPPPPTCSPPKSLSKKTKLKKRLREKQAGTTSSPAQSPSCKSPAPPAPKRVKQSVECVGVAEILCGLKNPACSKPRPATGNDILARRIPNPALPSSVVTPDKKAPTKPQQPQRQRQSSPSASPQRQPPKQQKNHTSVPPRKPVKSISTKQQLDRQFRNSIRMHHRRVKQLIQLLPKGGLVLRLRRQQPRTAWQRMQLEHLAAQELIQKRLLHSIEFILRNAMASNLSQAASKTEFGDCLQSYKEMAYDTMQRQTMEARCLAQQERAKSGTIAHKGTVSFPFEEVFETIGGILQKWTATNKPTKDGMTSVSSL